MTSIKSMIKRPPAAAVWKVDTSAKKSGSQARAGYMNRTNSKNHSNAGGSKDATRNSDRTLAPSLNIPGSVIQSRPPTIPASPNVQELRDRQGTPEGKYALPQA